MLEMKATNESVDADGTSLWSIRWTYQGRVMVHTYQQGSAWHSRTPRLADVLECLFIDAASLAGTDTFEEWADNIGLNSDSISDQKIYHAVLAQTNNLQRLFGADYSARYNSYLEV